MAHLVFFKLSNWLWNEARLAGQVSTQRIICACVWKPEKFMSLVPISAVESVSCQTGQHLLSLCCCHYSNFQPANICAFQAFCRARGIELVFTTNFLKPITPLGVICFAWEIPIIHWHTAVKGKVWRVWKKSMQIIPFTDLINTYFQIRLWEGKVIVTILQH